MRKSWGTWTALTVTAAATAAVQSAPSAVAAPASDSAYPVDVLTRPDLKVGEGAEHYGEVSTDMQRASVARAYFGLPVDAATLQRVLPPKPTASEPTPAPTPGLSSVQGVPLFDTEVPLVKFHMAVDQQLSKITESGELEKAVGPAFAGVWIDHKRGAEVTIASTGRIDPKSVAGLFPAGTPIVLAGAEYSMTELEDIRSTLTDEWVSSNQIIAGERLSGFSINPKDNTVNVLVPFEDRSRGDALKLTLRKRLPSSLDGQTNLRKLPLRIIYGDPGEKFLSNRDGNPLPFVGSRARFGGWGLFDQYTHCSIAFHGYTSDTNDPGYMSAGHCKRVASSTDVRFEDNFNHKFLGFQGWSIWTEGFLRDGPNNDLMAADGMFINNTNTNNWEVVYSSANKTVNQDGWRPTSSPYQSCGQGYIASLGQTDSFPQGLVADCNAIDFPYLVLNPASNGTYTVFHGIRIWMCAQGGDSGSPLGYWSSGNMRGVGIASVGNNTCGPSGSPSAGSVIFSSAGFTAEKLGLYWKPMVG